MLNNKALLLIGSPKRTGSTSEKLGHLLLKCLHEYGFGSHVEHIGNAIRNNNLNEVVEKVNESDIIIISTPLYVDSLPAPLISFLETYRNDHQNKDKMIVGIVNSGFPEPYHNNTAIENLRIFALQSDLIWSGGFAIGGGGAFNSDDLSTTKMAKNIVKAFEKAALFLSKRDPIPPEAIKLASYSLIPRWMYVMFGQIGWIVPSINYGTTFKLFHKPYAQQTG